MSHTIYRFILLAACFMAASTTAMAADWGTLSGKFVFDGKPPAPKPLDINKDLQCCKVKHNDESLVVGPDGGVANVIVYLRTPKVAVNPEYEGTAKDNVELNNHTCHFEPHVVVLRTSQTLLIKNSDMCSHNTNLTVLGGTSINPLIGAGGEPIPYQFARQSNLPATVNCNIHPWMSAYVLARDNPYFAVTKEDGSFEIKDLPVGELEFQAWQERCGYVDVPPKMPKGKFKMKIKAGNNDLGTIKSKFTKK